MQGLKNPFALLCAFYFLSLLLPEVIRPETVLKAGAAPGSEPIVINSKTVEMNNELKVVTFKGDVNAKKDNFIINCDNMLVYYEGSPAQSGKGDGNKTKIDKIVASGNVIINRAKGGKATAEKAVYHQKDEKMVLMGNPTVEQGNDLVKGDRITIFLNEDRSIVESSKDSKVSVTISPRRPER